MAVFSVFTSVKMCCVLANDCGVLEPLCSVSNVGDGGSYGQRKGWEVRGSSKLLNIMSQ